MNPTRHVKKYKEHKRQRYLASEEFIRLGKALSSAEKDKTETPYVIALFRLLMFTAARCSEIRTAKWDWVDFSAGELRLPDSKTGQKTIYLSAPALEILNDLPREEGNPYIICGKKPGSHLVNYKDPWARIKKTAGLEDVRPHDLRHSFASIAVSGGMSLPMIGALLGHTQAQTTARYAHLASDPLKAAAGAVSAKLNRWYLPACRGKSSPCGNPESICSQPRKEHENGRRVRANTNRSYQIRSQQRVGSVE